jgi:hypothetical protein
MSYIVGNIYAKEYILRKNDESQWQDEAECSL